MVSQNVWQTCRFIFSTSIATTFSVCFSAAIANAQPQTTTANNTNTTINLVGNDFRIGGGAGTTNLFHEFQDFNLNTNQSATFAAPNSVNNILGYVLGGNISTINGALRTFGGDANLFLINPSGIIFSDTASLDINGGFTATTATRIGFSNGKNINLEQLKLMSPPSSFYDALTGAPQIFDFSPSNGQVGNIDIAQNATLTVPTDKSIAIIGGNVRNAGELIAPSGNILLGTAADQTTLRIQPNGQILSLEFTRTPNLSITDLPILLTGKIQTASKTKIGGNIVINALGNIQGQNLNSRSRDKRSGIIDIFSFAGDGNLDNIQTFSQQGIGGDVSIDVEGNLVVENINSFGQLASGDIRLRSRSGSIKTQNLFTDSPNVVGDIELLASGGIRTQNIAGGTVSLTSSIGNISTGEISESNKILLDNPEAVDIAQTLGQLAATTELPLEVKIQSQGESKQWISAEEETRQTEFEDFFGRAFGNANIDAEKIQAHLQKIYEETGSLSAMVYINFPAPLDSSSPQPEQLEFLLFALGAEPIQILVEGTSEKDLTQLATNFQYRLQTSRRSPQILNKRYLALAEELHEYLITPIEPILEELKVDTLLFSMDSGLRNLPLAALYDGQQFLVEKYALGLVPSFGLMNYDYKSLEQTQVLAMGASTFPELDPLPAVITEIQAIGDFWSASDHLNEEFTRFNLQQQRIENTYPIIHLATHAEFAGGTVDDSYIHLWQEKLLLSQLPSLRWDNPAVELLVLSACQTALGNRRAELGFAGLAIASGAKTVLASLWTVSDEGTLALMSKFYDNLRETKVKAQALQSAQISMLRGELSIKNGRLISTDGSLDLDLPPALAQLNNDELAHPYFWSAFMMIGSPW